MGLIGQVGRRIGTPQSIEFGGPILVGTEIVFLGTGKVLMRCYDAIPVNIEAIAIQIEIAVTGIERVETLARELTGR